MNTIEKIEIERVETKIHLLLAQTKRKGYDKLYKFMKTSGFFTSPASTKYHGAYVGGLATHSLGVADLFYENLKKLKQLDNIPYESIIICSLLHDLCKAGAYIETKDGFEYNKEHPQGHAKLSIKLIEKYIDLTDLERIIIKYHMGYYYCTQASNIGEYDLSGLRQAQNNPLVKLFHWCDDMDSQFYGDKS